MILSWRMRPSAWERKPLSSKSHLGFTVNRAYMANQYVKRVYGENTGFTMYGGVVNE